MIRLSFIYISLSFIFYCKQNLQQSAFESIATVSTCGSLLFEVIQRRKCDNCRTPILIISNEIIKLTDNSVHNSVL